MTRRWNWGTGIALLYTTFAVSTISFVVFTTQQPVDLVSPDYYARSLAHDDRLAATARAAALDDAFSLTTSQDRRRLELSWTEMRPSHGQVTFYRPSRAAADRRVPIALAGNGQQSIAIADLAPGPWLVQVEWTAGGESYYVERRVILQ